ncbi:MAG: FkbM family methyltransferase, partial [Trebonia sp.]
VGYEPDPGNAHVLRRNLADGLRDGWYTLIVAAAGAADREARFELGLGDASHEAHSGSPVTVIDVLPAMPACDLAKIDIEGGEWEILQDSRLGTAGPTALVVECHADRSPEGSPRVAAERCLRASGYEILDAGRAGGADQAILWALRTGARRRCA